MISSRLRRRIRTWLAVPSLHHLQLLVLGSVTKLLRPVLNCNQLLLVSLLEFLDFLSFCFLTTCSQHTETTFLAFLPTLWQAIEEVSRKLHLGVHLNFLVPLWRQVGFLEDGRIRIQR